MPDTSDPGAAYNPLAPDPKAVAAFRAEHNEARRFALLGQLLELIESAQTVEDLKTVLKLILRSK